METPPTNELPISDEDFKSGLLEIGERTLPGDWVETWANQLVRTVPVEMRRAFLNNELAPLDVVSSISDEEIAKGL